MPETLLPMRNAHATAQNLCAVKQWQSTCDWQTVLYLRIYQIRIAYSVCVHARVNTLS